MPERLSYGAHPDQYALRVAGERDAPVAVVLHGGFWRARYTQEITLDLCAAVAELGWTAWNVEYRRVGAGGGYPQTLEDVRVACEALGPQLVVGHSAGGHLALWAAAEGLAPRAAAFAAVSDLRAAVRDNLGNGAAVDFLGGRDVPQDADPMQRLPIPARITLVHGSDDDIVPAAYSRAFAAATGCALLEIAGGGHFDVVDPGAGCWPQIAAAVQALRR